MYMGEALEAHKEVLEAREGRACAIIRWREGGSQRPVSHNIEIGSERPLLSTESRTLTNLGSPYSQASPPHTNYPDIELNKRTVIGSIIAERQQQLDAVLHEAWKLTCCLLERQVLATCIRAGSHAADKNMQTIEGYCYRLPILWCRLLVDVCDDQAAFSCNSCVRLSMISTGNCEKIDVVVKRISK
ncbi:hypothetical protein BD769DRAFT_1456260 [Suillus cothurnatus]|nr:hypothetical protein BD769DRAFT_1456260 [Suillus cothurnatus]